MASRKPNMREEESGDDARPMTEAEWEKLMKESDLRADRFGEILETVRDDPDADEIVAREMGYVEFADELKEYKRAIAAGEIESDDDGEGDVDEFEDDDEAEDDASFANPLAIDPEIEEVLDEQEAELERIPAYILASQAADHVRAALQPIQRGEDELDEDTSELIGKAFIGIHIACAKMSGGHAMGYDEDSLGGNVVNNRRGLRGAQDSIAAFEEMRAANLLPNKAIDQLLIELREVEAAMIARIAELRSNMWWDQGEKK